MPPQTAYVTCFELAILAERRGHRRRRDEGGLVFPFYQAELVLQIAHLSLD